MVTVRSWRQDDVPWLYRAAAVCAWEALHPEERAQASPADVAMRAWTRASQMAGTPMGTLLVAEVAGTPVAYAAGGVGPDASTGEPMGHILDIWVDPALRRRGLARRLHAALEAWFAAQGVRKVKLWTGLHNTAALASARANGYRPEGLIGRKRLA